MVRLRPYVIAPALVLAAMLQLAGCHDDRDGARLADHEQTWGPLRSAASQLGRRAEELDQLRQLLRWYSLTADEPGRHQIFEGLLEQLITRKQLLGLHALESSPLPEGRAGSSALERQARRRLRYLRHHLTLLHVQRRSGAHRDGYINTLLLATGSGDQRVRAADFPSVLAATFDRGRRLELQLEEAALLPRLEQHLQRQYALARQETRRLGLSLFSLLEQASEQETREQIHQALDLAERTRTLFGYVWGPMASAVAGGASRKLHLADLHFIRAGADLQGQLPERQLRPALELLQQRIGLGAKQGAGGPITALSEGVATSCVPVSAPTDLRVSYRSSPGLWSYVRLFEASGEAICRAHGGERPWVFQAGGPQTGARALGRLLGLVWLEPGWWQAYNELLPQGARLSDEQVSDLLRVRLLIELLRIRLEGVVMPAVRVALEGGPPGTYAKAWSGEGAGTPAALFERLVQRQLGLKLREGENLAYLHELGGPDELLGLGRPDDLRAQILAHMALERARRQFGAGWYLDRRAGPYLVKQLCSAGSAASATELARSLGFSSGLASKAPVRVLDGTWTRLTQGPRAPK